MNNKIIRDPLYGYIIVDKRCASLLVDHYMFQRLRRIEQTSMRVLFPSARHDRFAHSLGVYFLGKKAFTHFKANIESDLNDDIREANINQNVFESLEISFVLACLLHDIGHSPFSHTFEFCYERQLPLSDKTLKNTKVELVFLKTILLDTMKNLVDADRYELFCRDFSASVKYQGSPHEMMSALVILEKFSQILIKEFNDVDIDLLIRSIIGCTYYHYDANNKENCIKYGIRNCLIRLLNSDVIDVDKLDYLNRDMIFTGYDNVLIDIERLLSSLTAIKINENNCMRIKLAYRKSALSVLENAISAKKSFERWVYNHHAIECEQGLFIEGFIKSIHRLAKCPNVKCEYKHECEVSKNSCIELKNGIYEIYTNDVSVAISAFFSLQAVTNSITCNNFKISSLSDDDVWYLFKINFDLPEVKEIYHRNERRRPICKSDEELRSLILQFFKQISLESLNQIIKQKISENNKDFPQPKFFDISELLPDLQKKNITIWVLDYSKSTIPMVLEDIIGSSLFHVGSLPRIC